MTPEGLTPEELTPLLRVVARNLGVSVRVSDHDAHEWSFAAPYDGPGSVVRLGAGGGLTLLRSFSPFDATGDGEIELGFLQRRQVAGRVLSIARSIDDQLDVSWHAGDLTAVLERRIDAGDVTEHALTRALATLEDVVQSCREDASAVVQGVADEAPVIEVTPVRVSDESQRQWTPGPGGPSQTVFTSQLVPAILVTLCCCNPLGIVAIVFAVRAQSLAVAGDDAGAQQAANTAKVLWIVALVLGLVGMCSFGAVSDSGF